MEFVCHHDEEKDELCGKKQFEEDKFSIFDGKSVILARLARAKLCENQGDDDQSGERVSSSRRQIKRGEHRVKIGLAALHDRNRGIVNDEPEQSLKDKQAAESDDESRYFLAHDQIAHARPNKNASDQSYSHRQRRRPFVLEDKNAGDTAKKADTASGRQIDVAREDDEQHSHGERGGDRQLGREQREIARAQKLRRDDGEERANHNERDHQR